MTAQEIRHALRAGSVDPFDLVAQEGSQIKTELVEVDEIFQEDTRANVSESETSSPAPSQASPSQNETTQNKPLPKPPEPAPPAAEVKTSSRPKAARRTSRATPEGGEKSAARKSDTASKQDQAPRSLEFADQEALKNERRAQRNPVEEQTRVRGSLPSEPEGGEKTNLNQLPRKQKTQPGGQDRKKKEKKFYLTDEKNRVLGPLSATEVQSLFYRGILGASVKVQKSGTNRKIPIRQFISAYSGKRMKALAEGGGIKGGSAPLPSSKVLHELYHLMNSKKLAESRMVWPSVGLMILGVALGLLLFFILDQKQQTNVDEAERRSAIRKNLIQSEIPESEPEPSSARRAETPPKSPPSSKAAKEPPKRSNRPSTKAARPTVKKESPSPPPSRDPTPVKRPSPRPSRAKAAAVPPSSRPANMSGSRAQGPIAKARANVGGVLTVGPLSFSRQELNTCELKCEISFRDRQGDTLTAVFFKGAYYDQLANKDAVTLTGSSKLQNGKIVLFIQDIR